MRSAFLSALLDAASRDPAIWLLCGDLGYSVLEPFADRYPERFVNMGVAEQNMVGVAAGLALSGKKVFIYSIANFPTMRCLEQVRNDVCYHKLDVTVVSVGGGFAYGSAGYSHHGLEDLAVMRVMPNLRVFAPGDPTETIRSVEECARTAGPCYLRLGKGGEPLVHTAHSQFDVRRLVRLREGKAATIVSSAGTLGLCGQAVQALASEGIDVELLSAPMLWPFDEEALILAAEKTRRVITVEAHGRGGLGTIAAEILSIRKSGAALQMVRFEGPPEVQAGSEATLRAKGGVSPEAVCEAVRRLLR